MVALESLACGTPVVASRVGAMEELLRDRDSGRLASDLRPESLAAAINRMLIGRVRSRWRPRPSGAPYCVTAGRT